MPTAKRTTRKRITNIVVILMYIVDDNIITQETFGYSQMSMYYIIIMLDIVGHTVMMMDHNII